MDEAAFERKSPKGRDGVFRGAIRVADVPAVLL